MPNINGGVLDGLRRIGAKVRDLAIDGGLPGAPLGYRLRGATQSGPPTTGTWKAGDQVPDRAGAIWICTAGGTGPAATWVQAIPMSATAPAYAEGRAYFDTTLAKLRVGGASGWETVTSVASGGYAIGQQAAYAKITAPASQVLTSGAFVAITGAPSITLPNDGNTYRVHLTGYAVEGSGTGNYYVGIGTAAGTQLATQYNNVGITTTPYAFNNVECQSVTGSGQTVTVYGYTGGTQTITLLAQVAGFSGGPCELAAYRVA